jgi:FtsP/CotA-like multicopper oxidase with cupredoxin domain
MNGFTRRSLLGVGIAAGVGLLGACGTNKSDPTTEFIQPDGAEVAAAEASRHPGRVNDITLNAAVSTVDLGGRTVRAWTYNGVVAGPTLRVRAGEQIRAQLVNNLPQPTSVHWHGLALRNNADGVPDLTQAAVPSGGQYTYQFAVPEPGTYWLHPHVGTQLDRGLYAPLIVDDPADPGDYDAEWIVVLDDWLDTNPDDTLANLRRGMTGMGGGTMMGSSSVLLGGDAGDVTYPHYLINGRLPTAPATFTAKPGTRLRLRLINAGADTAFRVALGGHGMRVTHTDGYPTQPIDTDALLIGMGERYDVTVTLADGVFPLVALAEGKNARAFAVIRTGGGAVPAAEVAVAELDRRIVAYHQLTPAEPARLPARATGRTVDLALTGSMMAYDWGINGHSYDRNRITPVRQGERVTLRITNKTTMWHPIHLHGHTFAVGDSGLRKDTAIVLPGQTIMASFDADNPGLWMLHCHNVYHAEAGMMILLGYQR